LHAIAFSVPAARRALRVDPHKLVGAGLLLAAGSGMISLLQGLPFMTGQWIGAHLPGLGELKVGTPIVFDAGVYLVVLGGTLLIIFTLVEE
jgi:multicomponent Na+:H+ antiporter subunit B